eukprot:41564-Prorocentrum_minimum.AAC.1
MLAGPKGREAGEGGELDKAVRKASRGRGAMGVKCILAVVGTGGPAAARVGGRGGEPRPARRGCPPA